MPVATVFENLEDLSVEEMMEQFDVTREQIEPMFEFVAHSLRAYTPELSEPPALAVEAGAVNSLW
jgi:predicted DNA-binding protein YlxM (UPF0122 family)